MNVSPHQQVTYVLSLNLHRRQLTTGQRSVAAAKAEIFREKAKERQKMSKGQGVKGPANLPDLNKSGQARDEAGKAFGVSGKSVDSAAKVLRQGTPELVA